MELIRWNPFGMLSDIDREFDRLLDDRLFGSLSTWPISTEAWSPRVDILEEDGRFVITAEVPGIDKDDIKVNLENGNLTISGERTFENEERMDDYHRVERSYGSFHRHFHLPKTLERDKVEATMADGILTITLPKKPEVKPKKVKVK